MAGSALNCLIDNSDATVVDLASVKLSNLFFNKLKAENLLEIVSKILNKQSLDKNELLKLSKTSPAVLLKIIETIEPTKRELFIFSSNVKESSSVTKQMIHESTEDFIDQLLVLRKNKSLLVWSAELKEPLDSLTLETRKPFGLQVLTSIALARIVLGEKIQIVAPINLLGENLASLAILYGANSLGFMPEDKKSELLRRISGHRHIEFTINNY